MSFFVRKECSRLFQIVPDSQVFFMDSAANRFSWTRNCHGGSGFPELGGLRWFVSGFSEGSSCGILPCFNCQVQGPSGSIGKEFYLDRLSQISSGTLFWVENWSVGVFGPGLSPRSWLRLRTEVESWEWCCFPDSSIVLLCGVLFIISPQAKRGGGFKLQEVFFSGWWSSSLPSRLFKRLF